LARLAGRKQKFAEKAEKRMPGLAEIGRGIHIPLPLPVVKDRFFIHLLRSIFCGILVD